MKSEIALFLESFFWIKFAHNLLYVSNLDCVSLSNHDYKILQVPITEEKSQLLFFCVHGY